MTGSQELAFSRGVWLGATCDGNRDEINEGKIGALGVMPALDC